MKIDGGRGKGARGRGRRKTYRRWTRRRFWVSPTVREGTGKSELRRK
ncbi:unnamed protein product [Linum tenue]|uniref:Uncharacterized protein n=1 Tax=Linum tenue TaxID=586396 RepID=A0AAV0N5V5_9ROSI|nr:unnamed protein product [Linum tenue]